MDLTFSIFVTSPYAFPKVTVMLILMVLWGSVNLKGPSSPHTRSLVLGHCEVPTTPWSSALALWQTSNCSGWGSSELHFHLCRHFTRSKAKHQLSVPCNPVPFLEMKYYLSFPLSGSYNLAISLIFRP